MTAAVFRRDRLVRLTLGATVAPIGGVTLSALGITLNSCLGLECSIVDVGQSLKFILFIGAFFGAWVGLPVMLLIGIPLHAAMVKVRHTGWLPYLLCGAAAGVVGAGAVASLLGVTTPEADIQTRMSELMRGTFQSLPLGIATGAICSSIFWLIRRPDRDARQSSSRTRDA